MAYYLGYAGDYYRGDYYRGDPGILGTIGRTLMKVAAPVVSLLPGGGLIAGALGALSQQQQGPVAKVVQKILPPQPGGPGMAEMKIGPIGINPSNMFPGGQPFMTFAGPQVMVPRKRRRMNPANPRALRRAIRREQAFVALARRSLKGTGLVIHRSSSFAHKKRKR